MKHSQNRRHFSGQGMVEYGLALALMAVVVIGALTIMGPTLGKVFSNVAYKVPGSGGGQVAQVTPCLAPATGCVPGTFTGGMLGATYSSTENQAINSYCANGTPARTGYNIYENVDHSYIIAFGGTYAAPWVFQGIGVC